MKDLKRMKLGVVAAKHFWADPEGIKTTGGFGRQMEEIGRYFAGMVLIVPFAKLSVARPGYIVEVEGLEIVALPCFSGAGVAGKLDFLAKAPVFAWRIWRARGRCDLVQYRVPSYVGVLGLAIHQLSRRRPAFAWMAGNWPESIRQTNRYRGRRLVADVVRRVLGWAIRGVPTFFVDGEMAEAYGETHPLVHNTVTTVLTEREIVGSGRARLGDPIRLLFVGRLAAIKGLPYLVEAVRICLGNGTDVRLRIVGEGPERARLQADVHDKGLGEHVTLEGYVPLGDQLWEAYRSADIFVLPSLSEGQPKVLVEAMASGLIVVASGVGGIPALVQDGAAGLLVEPRSAQAIAEAVERVMREPEMRRRIVRHALQAVRAYTIEEQTELLISELRSDLALLAARRGSES